MTSSVPGLLVAVLLMAALLGVLIGVASCSLLQRRQREASLAEEAQTDAQAAALAESAERLQRAEREREALRERLVAARAGERDAVARHEALRMHARTLGRRLEAQLAEQRASEERQIRLERALRVQREEYRLVDATAGDTPPGARHGAGSTDAADDGDLPVLGRRVGAEARGPGGDAALGSGVAIRSDDGSRARRVARSVSRETASATAAGGTPAGVGDALASDARSVGDGDARRGSGRSSPPRSGGGSRQGANAGSPPGRRGGARTVSRLGSGRLARSSARSSTWAPTGSAADVGSTMPTLDGDEYPALSEAELPDSIDALEFAASRTASTSR